MQWGIGRRRVIAVGFPTVYAQRTYLHDCVVDKTFIQSTNDQYGPRPELEKIVAELPQPKRLMFIDAEDHFFKGSLPQLEESIAGVP